MNNNNNNNNNFDIIDARLSTLESISMKLKENNEIMTNFITSISSIVSDEVKQQVRDEINANGDELKKDIINTVSVNIRDTVKDVVNERGLNVIESDKLKDARVARMNKLLNHPSDKYDLFIPFYQGKLRDDYRAHFKVSAYHKINPEQFTEAIEYINNFDVSSSFISWCKKKLVENYKNGFDNYTNRAKQRKLCQAFERYFGVAS